MADYQISSVFPSSITSQVFSRLLAHLHVYAQCHCKPIRSPGSSLPEIGTEFLMRDQALCSLLSLSTFKYVPYPTCSFSAVSPALASPFHALLPPWFVPSWLLAQTSAGPLSCTLWFDWDSPSAAVILSCASVQALSVLHPVGCVIHKPDTGTCDVLGPPPISLMCVPAVPSLASGRSDCLF